MAATHFLGRRRASGFNAFHQQLFHRQPIDALEFFVDRLLERFQIGQGHHGFIQRLQLRDHAGQRRGHANINQNGSHGQPPR